MKQTPLSDIHLKLGAKMAEFAGWKMPIYYEAIVAEHQAVRNSVGVFDISHMGQIIAQGNGVADWLNQLLTNDTAKLGDTDGQYTLMLNDNGGVIDDMIIYRERADSFLLVVNASKIEEDFDWMTKHKIEGIELINESDAYGGLAVQGPKATALWEKIASDNRLPERNGVSRTNDLILCRTGYTGEDGFELFAPGAETSTWFQKIIDAGATPCGLGARDTLRLEMGFPLNGNDLGPDHTPIEAGLGFFVKLKTDIDFIGRATIEKQKAEKTGKRLVAIKMTGKAPPPRHGYDVKDPETDETIGILSSGSQSPTLGTGIAMAYLPKQFSKIGTTLSIGIRNRIFPAEVVKKPFI